MLDPASRLARLRRGTSETHARIETVPALARLLAPDLGTADYVTVLRAMHAFLAGIEPAVARALAARPDAAALLDGSRPRALAEDLAWYGAAAPPPIDAPALSDTEAALGALYVIEGSGLGARVIARHLADTLGVAPGAGASFYGGQSAEAARLRWRRLCAVLDTPAAPGDLVAGALAAFEALEASLRQIDGTARAVRPPADAPVAADLR
jgi:heme oxygenase